MDLELYRSLGLCTSSSVGSKCLASLTGIAEANCWTASAESLGSVLSGTAVGWLSSFSLGTASCCQK